MKTKAAIMGLRDSYQTRLNAMPDKTELQRIDRRWMSHFIEQLNVVLDVSDDKE